MCGSTPVATSTVARERRDDEGIEDMAREGAGQGRAVHLEEEPSMMQRAITIVVRLLGSAVLLLGIGAAVLVINEAWQLYREPQRIERFAVAIEQGSNLDKFVGPVVDGAGLMAVPDDGDSERLVAPRPALPVRSKADTLRLSYFVAWIVVLGLLMVLGILAMSAITTGGQLALYETPTARMRREIRREMRRRERQAAGAAHADPPSSNPREAQ